MIRFLFAIGQCEQETARYGSLPYADKLWQPPYLKYTLSSSYVHKSDNRTLYDSLVIDRFGESWHWLNINPTPFMAFIESVLGYEQTRHDGYMTTYVRQIAFDDAQSWHGRLTYNTET